MEVLNTKWTTVVAAMEQELPRPERVVCRVGAREGITQKDSVECQLGIAAHIAGEAGYTLRVQNFGGLETTYEWIREGTCQGAAPTQPGEIAPLLTTAMYNTATPLERLQQAATYGKDMRAVQVRATDLQWLLDKWLAVCAVTKGD